MRRLVGLAPSLIEFDQPLARFHPTRTRLAAISVVARIILTQKSLRFIVTLEQRQTFAQDACSGGQFLVASVLRSPKLFHRFTQVRGRASRPTRADQYLGQ